MNDFSILSSPMNQTQTAIHNASKTISPNAHNIPVLYRCKKKGTIVASKQMGISGKITLLK